ncbi:MAG: YigZ family protein [Clostridia bacterium]|nr:YigZ family protein [Clostridia bacterium]
MLKTIKENVQAEIVEKKSRFIANIVYVQTEAQAEEELNRIRKKYYDAKHNCFAYSIITQTGIVNKSSDDGEPSKTAGAPILNIITKNELINVLVVVTRYFGGILLGTGGLVRAYSQSTQEVIKKAEFVIEQKGYELEITLNYNDFEKFKYFCKERKIEIINISYNEKIICSIELNNDEKDKLLDNLKELSFKVEKYKVIKEKNIRKNIDI